jgi:glycerate-2-kinase
MRPSTRQTPWRCRSGIEPAQALDNNGNHIFGAGWSAVVSRPTLTNVNDQHFY